MKPTEPIRVSRSVWNGHRWVAKDLTTVSGERVGEHFAIHKVIEAESPYRYTVTHVRTGWGLCRTMTKAEARRAVQVALEWPGIDWAKLTDKNQQTPAMMERGLALLRSLAESNLAADIYVVDGKVRRGLFG